MRKNLFLLLIGLNSIIYSQDRNDWKYLNQVPPSNTPIIFGKEIISTSGKNEHTLSVSSDYKEIYFTRDPDRITMVTRYENDEWTTPVKAHFTGREAIFTPDGQSLYYNNGDIWATKRDTNGWLNPVKLPATINTSGHEYYASFTSDGIMYFSKFYNGSPAHIYYAKETDNFNKVIDIGSPINDENKNSYHPFISQDGSYIIFNSNNWGDSFGGADLYISFKNEDNSWTDPLNMGSTINSDYYDLCPTLSPDRKYLFFTRLNNGTGNIYWVSSAVIDSLKQLVYNQAGIYKYIDKNNFKIFPNPAQKTLQIKHLGLAEKEVYYNIIDFGGKTLQRGVLNSNKIDILKLIKGGYLLKLETKGEIICEKILIE